MRLLSVFFCLVPALGAAQFVPVGTPDPNECDYTTVARGQNGAMGAQSLFVFESANAMKMAWPRLTGQPAEAAPTREVQWGRQQVIAVALGDQPSNTRVSIASIRRQNGRWVVKAAQTKPAGRTRGNDRPWVAVAVERKVNNPVLAVSQFAPSGIISGPIGGFPTFPSFPTYPGYPGGYGNAGYPYTIFRSGGICLVRRESVFVISTPVGFVRWATDTFGKDTKAQLPAVDWGNERLVALHAGQLDDPNLVLNVKAVRRTTKGLVVDAVLVPGQGGSPWTMVRLPAGDEKVELVVEKGSR